MHYCTKFFNFIIKFFNFIIKIVAERNMILKQMKKPLYSTQKTEQESILKHLKIILFGPLPLYYFQCTIFKN